jgi:lysophospholipase L1-like esterase
LQRILCFGDSNTWGYISGSGNRYSENVRWTGLLAAQLGSRFQVIEEGLNGRTTAFCDYIQPWVNGAQYLPPCVLSNLPLDLVIVMLGTNDTKRRYGLFAQEISTAMENLLHVLNDLLKRQNSSAKILLVSPVPMESGALSDPHLDQESIEKSKQLTAWYREAAIKESVNFLDAAEYNISLGEDGCHFSEEGHRRFSEVLLAEIKKILCTA